MMRVLRLAMLGLVAVVTLASNCGEPEEKSLADELDDVRRAVGTELEDAAKDAGEELEDAADRAARKLDQ
jgi:hypothetical protein